MFKETKLLYHILTRKPILILWQITGRCSFHCKICRIWKAGHTENEELSILEIRNVLSKIYKLRPLLITLAGGEPTLREDLPEIVKEVSLHHYSSIITNGYYMNRNLAKDLFKNGLRDAMVSLDYATPGRHDSQRGMKDAFHKAIDAIEYLRDAAIDKKSKVRILTVLMNDNINEIEGLLLIAKELNVSVSLTLYSDHLGKQADYRPERSVSNYLMELKKRYSYFDAAANYLSSFDKSLENGIDNCGGGSRFLTINPRGQIARCIDRYDSPCANPFADTTEEILKKLKFEQNQDPCSQCWTSCRGLADVISGRPGIKSYKDFIQASRPLQKVNR